MPPRAVEPPLIDRAAVNQWVVYQGSADASLELGEAELWPLPKGGLDLEWKCRLWPV